MGNLPTMLDAEKDTLKTLKDIELLSECLEGDSKYVDDNDVNKGECIIEIKKVLRQEAIKRIKYYRGRFAIMDGEEVIDLEGYHWTHGRMSGAISAWMLVFNITEEDLK